MMANMQKHACRVLFRNILKPSPEVKMAETVTDLNWFRIKMWSFLEKNKRKRNTCHKNVVAFFRKETKKTHNYHECVQP